MLKGEDIELCSRNEFSIIAKLFNLGVCNDIYLDFFVDTFYIQVQLEVNRVLSLPVTSKILELLCIRSSTTLRR